MTRSWAEVSKSALVHNLKLIGGLLSSTTELTAVVKANAYGHGLRQVVPLLLEQGVRRFAVAQLEEAIELREFAKGAPILVFGGCLDQEVPEFREYRLTASVFDRRPLPHDLPVELKIDTGMGRLGLPWAETSKFLSETRLNIEGLYSHFSAAESDATCSQLQIARFRQAAAGFSGRKHLCNSAGLRYPEAHFDTVRVGLALYGVSPVAELDGLRPILTWKTRVLTVNHFPADQEIGYGGSFRTRRPSRIAVLPVGYADGFNRLLSNLGSVGIRGVTAPVVGRVSMDLVSVDVTDIKGCSPGDEAVLLDSAPKSPQSVASVAALTSTIPYEVLTSIGRRVKRLNVD